MGLETGDRKGVTVIHYYDCQMLLFFDQFDCMPIE